VRHAVGAGDIRHALTGPGHLWCQVN
jgi:hypothetical protein